MNKDTDRNQQAMPESADFDLLAQGCRSEIVATIQAALTEIEPEPGAETRMYQNILKAAAQGAWAHLQECGRGSRACRTDGNKTFDFSVADLTFTAAGNAQDQQTAPVAAGLKKPQTALPAVTPIRSARNRKWRRYLSLAACLVPHRDRRADPAAKCFRAARTMSPAAVRTSTTRKEIIRRPLPDPRLSM